MQSPVYSLLHQMVPASQTEAQQSGFGLERRRNGVSKPSPAGGGEGYKVCAKVPANQGGAQRQRVRLGEEAQ